jgi:hypothetical protein
MTEKQIQEREEDERNLWFFESRRVKFVLVSTYHHARAARVAAREFSKGIGEPVGVYGGAKLKKRIMARRRRAFKRPVQPDSFLDDVEGDNPVDAVDADAAS